MIKAKVGDIVTAKFEHVGGIFFGRCRVTDRMHCLMWDEKARKNIRSEKLTQFQPPVFEVLDGSDSLPTGCRIWGSWNDIEDILEVVNEPTT